MIFSNKDDDKAEIERLRSENDDLKAQIEELEAAVGRCEEKRKDHR